MNSPDVKMAAMAIIEDDLWIYLVCSTDCLEIHHFLHPSISVHITILFIVDYSVIWNVAANILGVVFCMVNYHRWYEAMAISYGEDESFAP